MTFYDCACLDMFDHSENWGKHMEAHGSTWKHMEAREASEFRHHIPRPNLCTHSLQHILREPRDEFLRHDLIWSGSCPIGCPIGSIVPSSCPHISTTSTLDSKDLPAQY